MQNVIDKIYLASQSLGRRGILERNGIVPIVCPTDTDESGSWPNPWSMVEDLALRKLESFIKSGQYMDSSLFALASDTVVVLDSRIIGKASDIEGAEKQLRMLSGHAHYVYSSFAVYRDGKTVSGWDRSTVVFRDISGLIKPYLIGGEWNGAAGSYRIQGDGVKFVESITGDPDTVTGLPFRMIMDVIGHFDKQTSPIYKNTR